MTAYICTDSLLWPFYLSVFMDNISAILWRNSSVHSQWTAVLGVRALAVVLYVTLKFKNCQNMKGHELPKLLVQKYYRYWKYTCVSVNIIK